MAYALGFVIAIAIGLTGVGAGTLTTPLLILALGVPARIAVGTSLIFGAVVKIITSPVYMARRQVDWRTLCLYARGRRSRSADRRFHLLRGVDGKVITGVIGATIVIVAVFNLFRPSPEHRRDKTKWLALIALPIGTEVGFSSAGAGALGALSLLSLTKLSAAAVVGTDLVFGLVVSLIGGGVNAAMGTLDQADTAATAGWRNPGSHWRCVSCGTPSIEAAPHGAVGSHGAARREPVLSRILPLARRRETDSAQRAGPVVRRLACYTETLRFLVIANAKNLCPHIAVDQPVYRCGQRPICLPDGTGRACGDWTADVSTQIRAA